MYCFNLELPSKVKLVIKVDFDELNLNSIVLNYLGF